jgi:transposase
MLLLSRKEKEKLVIKLANEGKTIMEIAKQVHVSLKDIGKILRKVIGDDDESPPEKEKEEQKNQKRLKSLSPYARSFQMFKDKRLLADVAIELDIKTNAVLNFYSDYLRLVRMNHLVDIYQDLRDDWSVFILLYKRIKKEGLNKQDITKLLENQNKLVELDDCVNLYNDAYRTCD